MLKYLHIFYFYNLRNLYYMVVFFFFRIATPEMSYTSQGILTFLDREVVKERWKRPMKHLVSAGLETQQVITLNRCLTQRTQLS